LMAELAVARERIDSLERILVSKGVLAKDEIEKFVPTEEQGKARQIAQVEYSARILRSLQQEVESMAEKQPLSMDEMADKLREADSSENTDA
jgi:polyhydroxyalkanoate synthesis regulator phasin